MIALQRALKTHFGFDKFRSQQQEDVVKAVIRGKFVLEGYGDHIEQI